MQEVDASSAHLCTDVGLPSPDLPTLSSSAAGDWRLGLCKGAAETAPATENKGFNEVPEPVPALSPEGWQSSLDLQGRSSEVLQATATCHSQ